MSPETERNVNNFVNAWNRTGAVLGLILCLAIGLPLVLILIAGLFSSDEAGMGIGWSIGIICGLLVAFWGRKYDGISIFEIFGKKKPEEDSSVLPSEAENRKRAESLWKF